jgi:acyl carrier protein
MVFTSLSSVQHRPASEVGDIRALVARQLHVDLSRVTDDAHFRDDLGADWLDRLELLTLIEDIFTDVEITDDDADQIEVVGDLIRHVEEAHGRVRHYRAER